MYGKINNNELDLKMQHYVQAFQTEEEKAVTSASVLKLVDNTKDISALADDIKGHAEMIEAFQNEITALESLDYSENVCEELVIDDVKVNVIDQDSARTIRDIIIRSKKQFIIDWTSEIVEMKKRLAKLVYAS